MYIYVAMSIYRIFFIVYIAIYIFIAEKVVW